MDIAQVSLSLPFLPAMDDTEEILSREDLAWVDPCLVRDAGILGKNWDAGKDALLDLINSVRKQALPFELLTLRGTDLILTESKENDGGDSPSQVEPSSPTNFKNFFRPNYNVFLYDIFSHEDIFKVWDLDVPEEEGELSSQLQKALAQTSPRQPQESLPESDGEGNLRELQKVCLLVESLHVLT